MDKLHAMQLFVRVAETGSFAAVADQLDVSRSVVTRQISALEKQLGTKLMTRSTRSLTLTTAGSDYLEKCRAILNMVDAAESSLLEEKTEPRGRIRLGLPLSFGLQRLMPALLKFAEKDPWVQSPVATLMTAVKRTAVAGTPTTPATLFCTWRRAAASNVNTPVWVSLHGVNAL